MNSSELCLQLLCMAQIALFSDTERQASLNYLSQGNCSALDMDLARGQEVNAPLEGQPVNVSALNSAILMIENHTCKHLKCYF